MDPGLIVGAVIVAMILIKRISSASPEMLRKQLAEGALVIDVRSPEEFRRDHVPGALNIPLNELGDKCRCRCRTKTRCCCCIA